jgi:hypothetical protein
LLPVSWMELSIPEGVSSSSSLRPNSCSKFLCISGLVHLARTASSTGAWSSPQTVGSMLRNTKPS